MKLIAAAFAASLLATSASAAPIQLIKNGSFEANGVGAGSWAIKTALDNWLVGSLGAEVRNNIVGAASNGSNYLELDTTANSWISQSLTTYASALYTVTFDYAPRENIGAASNGIEVFWGGKSYGVFTSTGASHGNDWHKYSFTALGKPGSTSLEFRAVGTSDALGGSLDNVSVTADIPEPATIGTMGLGLALLALSVRRRRDI